MALEDRLDIVAVNDVFTPVALTEVFLFSTVGV